MNIRASNTHGGSRHRARRLENGRRRLRRGGTGQKPSKSTAVVAAENAIDRALVQKKVRLVRPLQPD
jgi:hypothetical protein